MAFSCFVMWRSSSSKLFPLSSASSFFYLRSKASTLLTTTKHFKRQTAMKAMKSRAVQVTESNEINSAFSGVEINSTNKGVLDCGLYLVATPIGNLEDITLRALHVLKSADLILSEDTRHSGKLLKHYNINTLLMSFHKFNESSRQETVIQRLQQGQSVVVVSDAGTPGISDPGTKMVKACIQKGIRIYPIPGPCAAITALTSSGLPTDEFSFIGFLPSHSMKRKQKLIAAAKGSATQVLYVPPHKLITLLEEIIAVFGEDRQCVIAREMTKWHEEFWRGSLEEAKLEFSKRNPKGEITLLIQGAQDSSSDILTEEELECELQALLSGGHTLSEAVRIISEAFAIRRKLVYNLGLKVYSRK